MMTKKFFRVLLRILKGLAILAITVIIVGWLVWVPSAKEAGYDYVATWGRKGTGPGEFRDPTGIAVSGAEVFVSDARNTRIQVFDFEGRFKRQFGSKGDGPGQLGRPMNLTVSGDALFVADYFNDRVQVFGLDGTPRFTVGTSGNGSGQFNAPGGVAVAANGDLIVADFYGQRVQRLRPDGTFVRQWGSTDKVGIWAGQMNYPTDVALTGDGTLYIADGYNDRVQMFDPSGVFVRKWGGPLGLNIKGPFNGWFTTVTSITLDPQGNVFTADFYNHRVQKFTAEGTFLTTFGGAGDGPGQMDRAIAVAVARDGTVFVVDFGNHRVQKWRPKQ